ncbi:hypothetical protein LINGRAHAP2_LOCUS1963, partial [Linum grandiflorum]
MLQSLLLIPRLISFRLIQDFPHLKTIGIAKLHQGLYLLRPSSSSPSPGRFSATIIPAGSTVSGVSSTFSPNVHDSNSTVAVRCSKPISDAAFLHRGFASCSSGMPDFESYSRKSHCIDTWHYRLGHIGSNRMHILSK